MRRLERRPGALLTLALMTASPAWAQDADGDGVPDSSDAYPCDPERAGVTFLAGAGGHGALLFEYQWPAIGDADFNDAVIGYSYVLRTDASGALVSLTATYNVMALGGIFDNGLGLQLPIPAAQVAQVTRTLADGSSSSLSSEPGDAQLTVVVSNNLRELFGGQPGIINAINGVSLPTATLQVDVVLAAPFAGDIAAEAPFDVFLFRAQQRGLEVHRTIYGGTHQMDTSLFNTASDRSSPGHYFVDERGLPFVLDLPALTVWPSEGTDLALLWPDVLIFAASAGAQGRDFYSSTVVTQHAWDGASTASPRLLTHEVPDTSCNLGVCPEGHHPEAEVCVPDVRACDFVNGTGLETWLGEAFGACLLDSCDAEHHEEDGLCVSDTRTCAVPGGSGTQTFAGGIWTDCVAVSCDAGFHLENGACVSDIRSCAITNGAGIETWTGSEFGPCTVVSCDEGFEISGNGCVASQPSFSGSVTCGSGGLEIGCGGAWGMRVFPFSGRTYEIEISTSPTMATVSTGVMWQSNPGSTFVRWEINSDATFTPAITFSANTTYHYRLVEVVSGVRRPSTVIRSFTTRSACQFGDLMYRSAAFQGLSARGGLTVRASGNILAGDFPGDTNTGRIQELTPNLQWVAQFASGANQIYGIDVDETGAVWGTRIGNQDFGSASDMMARWSSSGSLNTPTSGARPPLCTSTGTNGTACTAGVSGHHFGWGPAMSCTDAFNRTCCNWGDPGIGCNGRFQSGARGRGLAVRSSNNVYVVDQSGHEHYNHWQIFNGSSYPTTEAGVFGINNKFSGFDNRVHALGQGAYVGGGTAGHFVWQTGTANSYAYIWFPGDATTLRNKHDAVIRVITNPTGFRSSGDGTGSFAFTANRFGSGTRDRLPLLYWTGTGDRRHVSIFQSGSIIAQRGASTSNPTTTELAWRRPTSNCGEYQHAPLISVTSDGDRFIYASDGAFVYRYFRH